jgi:hypothetical protein
LSVTKQQNTLSHRRSQLFHPRSSSQFIDAPNHIKHHSEPKMKSEDFSKNAKKAKEKAKAEPRRPLTELTPAESHRIIDTEAYSDGGEDHSNVSSPWTVG